MKRSAIQCVAGAVGATLIVVGVVWTCRQLGSPTQLNAAPVVPGTSAVRTSSSLKLSTERSASTVNAPNRIRSTSGSQLSLSLVDGSKESNAVDASDVELVERAESPSPFVAPAPLDSVVPLEPPLVSDETASVSTAFPSSPTPFPAFESEPASVDSAPVEAATPNPLVVSDSALETFDEGAPLADVSEAFTQPADAPISASTDSPRELESATALPALDSTSLSAVSVPLSTAAPDASNFQRPDRQVPSAVERPQVSFAATPSAQPVAVASVPLETSFDASSDLTAPSTLNSTSNVPTGRGVPGDKALEGPQTTQIIVEKVAPEEIQVGVETSFLVKVKNLGTSTVRGIVLRDALPAGSTFVSAEPSVEPTEQGVFVWPAFDLESLREKTFEYRIVPTQEGEIGSVATVAFEAEASCKTRCVKPELQVEVNVPQEATLGDNIDFEIVVSNVGSGSANGVALLETIPTGLYHPNGSVLNNDLGTLKPGEKKRLPLTLQCAASGSTVNSLVVTAEGGIEKRVETEIKILAPALELSIDGTETPYLERTALYRLKVKNVGDAPAKDVKLVAEIPDGTEFVSANNLGAFKEDARSVYWDLAELPVAAEGEIELTLKPTEIATSQLTFGGTGPNNLTAQVAKDVAIDGLPALSFSVKTSNDPVEVGKEVEYEIQITNRGTKASTNALLQAALPATMQVVSTDGPTRASNRGGTVVFDKIREIPAKSVVAYNVKATASQAGDCRVGFQLSSDDLEPLVKEENTRVYQ